jgi:hypothetical protein
VGAACTVLVRHGLHYCRSLGPLGCQLPQLKSCAVDALDAPGLDWHAASSGSLC